MATIHGQKKYVGSTLEDILVQAQQQARDYAPGRTGKVWTRIEAMGSGEDDNGAIRMWADVSFHEDN